MTSLCEQVDRFSDGELSPEEAEAFRNHVVTCARCQAELDQLAQLHVLECRYQAAIQDGTLSAPTPLPSRPPVRLRPQWRWAGAGALAALAAMLLWTFSWRLFDQVPDGVWYPAGANRLPEGRSAYARARRHRPLPQAPLGPQGSGALSYEGLAKLERRGDLLGVAAARLARGTARDAEEALPLLERLEPSADVLSELAFAHLVRRDTGKEDFEAALRLADQALDMDPRHGPALWNRALALRALGLDLLAARSFEAAAALGEEGWKDEALGHAGRLRREAERAQKAWQAARSAGRELVEKGTPPSPQLLAEAPVLRRSFYEAVHAATSQEEVLRLLPLARQMDAHAGNTALADHVRAAAGRSFRVRGPLAAEYRRLAIGPPGADASQLLKQLRASPETGDLLLAALALDARSGGEDIGELERLARDSAQDAWLHTQALMLKARALTARGDDGGTQATLKEALRRCQEAGLDFRCAEIELALAYAFDRAWELEEAQAHARQGWALARRTNAWGVQVQFILELAQVARSRDDTPLARAYYEEALERDQGAERRRYAHEGLANLDVHWLRFDDARRHIDAAIATGRPLGLPGVVVLSDIARLRPSPQQDAKVMQALQERLAGPAPGFGAGERALAYHALGRWMVELDRQKGIAFLRQAISLAKEGDLARRDAAARQALGYSYTSLILDAGKQGHAEEALRLFEEEWLAGARGTLPPRCLLAVTVDSERTLVAVRGPHGGPATAFYDAGRTRPLPGRLAGLVPPEAKQALSGCPKVDVLARAPVYGRPGLLPSDVAWSYRGVDAPEEAGPPLPFRKHLVVQQVTMAAARRPLETPEPWEVAEVDGERLEQLRLAEATPSAVLRRMEDATDITFVAHALVHPHSEEAFLVLAPEPQGDALRASQIQSSGVRLRGRPLVVLASCRGAQPGPVLHEPRSLPAAFLRAGARAVLAAADPIPEKDGPELLAAVRARIRDGAAPAEALRLERAAWLSRGRGADWLEGVLLFE